MWNIWCVKVYSKSLRMSQPDLAYLIDRELELELELPYCVYPAVLGVDRAGHIVYIACARHVRSYSYLF